VLFGLHLRGGYADLDYTDDFTRSLEKRLGGREKAQKSLVESGFGKLMQELDDMTRSIASTGPEGLGAKRVAVAGEGRERARASERARESSSLDTPHSPPPHSRHHALPSEGEPGEEEEDACGAREAEKSKKRLKASLDRAPKTLAAVGDKALAGGISHLREYYYNIFL
jgi:hypothetical protein